MNGTQMMLKAMGFDPDALKTQIEQFGKLVVDFKAQLDRIEKKLDQVLESAENGTQKEDGTGNE